MSSVKFSCVVSPSDPETPLGCEIWIDDHCVFNLDHVTQTTNITHDLTDDNDGEHSLRICLKNKLSEHTTVDESSNIVSDAVLTVTNISFDEIDCSQIVHDHAVYQHSFNGNGAEIQEKFFDTLGCNGTVELKFATPVYLWLLENM